MPGVGTLTLIILLAVAAYAIVVYNALVRARQMVQEAWSGIDVQLKRRADLIPNLVETVKGYAGHEKEALERVTEMRARAQNVPAGDIQGRAAAEGMLTQALGRLLAVAEAYPDLKASDNFRTLQTQLADVEGDITVARQIYNDTTLTYNNAVQTIPTNIIASLTGFQRGEFFEVEDEGRSVPKVQF